MSDHCPEPGGRIRDVPPGVTHRNSTPRKRCISSQKKGSPPACGRHLADEGHLQPFREPGQEPSAPSLQTPANTQCARRLGTDLEQWLVTFAAASNQHTPATAERTLFQTILPTPVLPNPPRCIRFGPSILHPRKDRPKTQAVWKSGRSVQGQCPLSPESKHPKEGAAFSLLQL